MNIIIADDDRDLSTLLKDKLEKVGHQVTWVSASPKVRELSEIRPDLLLLDINLRHEDGGDACAAIKENVRTRDIPVILMSGLMDVKQISEMCGAEGYLMKPFSFQDFDRAISPWARPANESV